MFHKAKLDANGRCKAGYSSEVYHASQPNEVDVPTPVADYIGRTYANGAWSAPLPPPDKVLDRKGMKAALVAVFGGNSTGKTRRGALLKALDASTDAEVIDARDSHYRDTAFTKTEAVEFLTLCRQKNLPSADTTNGNPARKIEAAEILAMNNNWPVG